MKGLFLLSIGLTALYYYFGFSHREKNTYWAYHNKIGFFMFLLLALICGYAATKESLATQEIAQFITPYPGISQATFVPPIPQSTDKYWIFHTSHFAKDILDFYLQEENREGWKIIHHDSTSITLIEKNNLQMRISWTEDWKNNQIIYTMKER